MSEPGPLLPRVKVAKPGSDTLHDITSPSGSVAESGTCETCPSLTAWLPIVVSTGGLFAGCVPFTVTVKVSDTVFVPSDRVTVMSVGPGGVDAVGDRVMLADPPP